jgi:putative flippase GtrA
VNHKWLGASSSGSRILRGPVSHSSAPHQHFDVCYCDSFLAVPLGMRIPKEYLNVNSVRCCVPPNLKVEMTRFIGTGAARTLLTLALYQLLLLAMPYWLAYTLSFVTGILLAVFVGAYYVFGSGLVLRGLARFTLFYLASYVVGLGVLHVLVAGFGVSAALAAFIVIPLMLPINFIGSRIALRSS